MASNFISQGVAKEFVTCKLGVDLTTEDKLELLSRIVSRFMMKIPFQNLTFMATPKDKREIPTADECIKCVLEGYGGVCFALNLTM